MHKSLVISVIWAVVTSAHAQDVPKSDPQRKRILEAVRASKDYAYLADSQFVVKRLWASKRYAYLCALAVDKQGNYQATDDRLDLYRIILSKQGTVWVPVAEQGAFASSPDGGDCSLQDKTTLSDDLLKNTIEKWKRPT